MNFNAVMLNGFFNNIFDTLVRHLGTTTRNLISFILFLLAGVSLYLSIRKKNDAKPLSLGWFILTFVLVGISAVYLFV